MHFESAINGSLFAIDFLKESITSMDHWRNIDWALCRKFEEAALKIFKDFPTSQSPNESQTENDLVWPILRLLGWTSDLRQQNLSPHGRENVPDGLLFRDNGTKRRANGLPDEWKRYELGTAILESKRWNRPLDRSVDRPGGASAPSTQMLRYLRRVDDLTRGSLRWGILTNGSRWRLYWQGARTVSEEFFEADLPLLLGITDGESDLDEKGRERALTIFWLTFSKRSFIPSASQDSSFHEQAINIGRDYEERVASDLSNLVFESVFPNLTNAIAVSAPNASSSDIRDAALVLLYRLLFIFYAEDRSLLPVRDGRYSDYGMYERVRRDIGNRKDLNSTFSQSATRYWDAINDLCRLIDAGDSSIGLPPYNGGLFNRAQTPLLNQIRLSDSVMADVIDALSFEKTKRDRRRYINYRDLGVQQLGSIYERLLEFEVVKKRDGSVSISPNTFARRSSGSFYTPDDLVTLILNETIEPLIKSKWMAFKERKKELKFPDTYYPTHEDIRVYDLENYDPALRILDLNICDPAMGSGHFLVNLVDYLTEQIIDAMALVEERIDGYVSSLYDEIRQIRRQILTNANENKWVVDLEQLSDRHIIRRMVLKRCVHGVDKNPMAVELAKVSLWLHTFTIGAPLTFLEHHLRCGDSLFGLWVQKGIEKAKTSGTKIFLGRKSLDQAFDTASHIYMIERLTDIEIAEANKSATVFNRVIRDTRKLNSFLSLIHAFDWLGVKTGDEQTAITSFLTGTYGDPVDIAVGDIEINGKGSSAEIFAELFARARKIIKRERFLNWQLTFPRIWTDWESNELHGGFDAIIGNPPWDRIKLQQIEWFAHRNREIAFATRASERKHMINELAQSNDPLINEFAEAHVTAATMAHIARTSGDYPLLSKGDINLYSLFVERAMAVVKPDGMIGLLVPSGIASDKMASEFFRSITSQNKLKSLYDFENKKVFFRDVHSSFKFCVFIASRSSLSEPTRCGFFLHDVFEVTDDQKCFSLRARDFAKINPNTGTAPILRSRRDVKLALSIYDRLPIIVSRKERVEQRTWPIKYVRMFDMANDSGMFRTAEEIKEIEKGWPIKGNRWETSAGQWIALYEGKTVQAFDHRAADIVLHETNLFRPGQQVPIPTSEKMQYDRLPVPRYFVKDDPQRWPWPRDWTIAFKDITATTNVRTMIAAIIPRVGAGHTLPILPFTDEIEDSARAACMIVANLNAIPFDYVARQKVPATHLTWFTLEQIPVVSLDQFNITSFGTKSAAEIVTEAVLELTYTSNDMKPFARDLGFVTRRNQVRKPFRWNEERRLSLRAKLDAIFFRFYGITDHDDVQYVYSTFPILKKEEMSRWGQYRSRELCLTWMNALDANEPDADVNI